MRLIKVIASIATTFILFASFISPIYADSEYASRFTSDITVNQNTSITITETIQYHTDIERHGIYRYIPIRYNHGGTVYTTHIGGVVITDENDQSITFTQSSDSKNLTLKIGDPGRTFTGDKTYVIRYTVDNALTSFSDHDELYWDIVGEGWQFPIESTQATINSPYVSIAKSVCYSGPVGGNDNLCQITHTASQADLTYNHPIKYGDNVTVALSLTHPNQLIFPTPTQKFIKNLIDNWPILLIPVPCLLMFWLWLKKGRDWQFSSPNVFNLDPHAPKHLKPFFEPARTPFVYEPLKDLTPGQAGTMVDEKPDNQDVIAEIIDLARKKYVKLERIEEKKLIFTSKDYLFTRLKPTDENLPAHQAYLLDSLFGSASTKKLSDLKGTFYTHMNKTKEMINNELTKKGLFTANPTTSRTAGLVIAAITNGVIFSLLSSTVASLGIIWPYALLVLFGLISLGFGWNLVQKTAVGTNLMLQAKGLKQTIKWGKWREQIKEKNLFIEEVLPFAVALGVVNELAKDMEKLNLKPPDYLDSSLMRGMVWNSFITDFSSHAASTLAYNPSSSGWSGGSGFSGGGSGGGGGGGGGGGW